MASRITHQHVALSFVGMTDTERQSILAGIAAVAPTSPLYTQSTTIQSSYGSLVKQGATLKGASDAVTADRQKLEADLGVETTARAAFDLGLRSLATLTEAAATNPTDLSGMGFHPRTPVATAKAAPAIPSNVVVTIPKRHGYPVRVAATYDGVGKPHFVAQSSPDPIGPTTWAPLVGAGRTRAVTGASGSKLWVRFASVRGGLQSDFCTPVLVTFP